MIQPGYLVVGSSADGGGAPGGNCGTGGAGGFHDLNLEVGIQNFLAHGVGGVRLPRRDLGIVDASARGAPRRRPACMNACEEQLGWGSCIGIHDMGYWRARCGRGGKGRQRVRGAENSSCEGDLVQGRIPSGVAANIKVPCGVRRLLVGTVKSANVHGRRCSSMSGADADLRMHWCFA